MDERFHFSWGIFEQRFAWFEIRDCDRQCTVLSFNRPIGVRHVLRVYNQFIEVVIERDRLCNFMLLTSKMI